MATDDDEIGVLAVADEGLRAVQHIAVAVPDRARAHALQVGAGAGLGHGDGADQFAGGEPRQPAPLLLLGAVMQDVGRDDAGMERAAEGVEAGEAERTIDRDLVGEAAAGAAIFLRHRSAQQPGRAGLGPDLAVVHAGLVPAIEMRNELRIDEAARLLFEQHDVFGHPGGTGNVERGHCAIQDACHDR